MSFEHLSIFVDEFSISAPLSVQPVANVVIAVGVDKPTEPVVNVVHKLAFIDDVVDLLSHSSHFAALAQLSDDVLVELALTERKSLINWNL